MTSTVLAACAVLGTQYSVLSSLHVGPWILDLGRECLPRRRLLHRRRLTARHPNLIRRRGRSEQERIIDNPRRAHTAAVVVIDNVEKESLERMRPVAVAPVAA